LLFVACADIDLLQANSWANVNLYVNKSEVTDII